MYIACIVAIYSAQDGKSKYFAQGIAGTAYPEILMAIAPLAVIRSRRNTPNKDIVPCNAQTLVDQLIKNVYAPIVAKSLCAFMVKLEHIVLTHVQTMQDM